MSDKGRVFGLIFLLAISGCKSTQDSEPSIDDKKIAQYRTECQNELNALPKTLLLESMVIPDAYSKVSLTRMDFKVEVSSQNEEDREDLRLLGAARAACREHRLELGVFGNATDLIFEKRVDVLIAAVFYGDLTVGEFNYGVAQAALERSNFHSAAAEAYSEGEKIGAKMAMDLSQQIMLQSQLNSLNYKLNNLNTYKSTWYCSSSTVLSTTYTTCR
ncbi:MAG: hypothetical protein P1V34_05340 [Alphaproteobacteria bacterium]|nr:hypothetical protein [Alphaproteobacteria bacterium]